MTQYVCRWCDRAYTRTQSRAWFTGYCCKRCCIRMADSLGFGSNGSTMYGILKAADAVGDVPQKKGEQK